jgi:hypothetical protein
MIKFRIKDAELIVDWECTACGCPGNNDSIVCENVRENGFDDIWNRMRICPRCLKGGQAKIDRELKARAERLRERAAFLESDIGKFDVPPFEEWQRAAAEKHAEWLCRTPFPLRLVSDGDEADDGDIPF